MKENINNQNGFNKEKSINKEQLILEEKEAWKRVLGTEVEVKPLPTILTLEIKSNLEKYGFKLRYIPALNLEPEYLKNNSVEDYLKRLNERYPKWKPYDSLNEDERFNYLVSRNLKKWFWEGVKTNLIDFPKLPGQWVAVETIEKPDFPPYQKSSLTEVLGFNDRFNISWMDLNYKLVVIYIRRKNKFLGKEVAFMPGPKLPSDLLKNGGSNSYSNQYGGEHNSIYDKDSNSRMSWDTNENGEYINGTGHDKPDQNKDRINRWKIVDFEDS